MDQDRPRSQWWPTFGVMLGALTVSLNFGVLNVAIPTMMSRLSADLDRIQWASTGYQIVQAFRIPAVGWLGARLGTKRLFLVSTLTFITGSALCGLAWDLPSLILFRILQGIGGGPITPLGRGKLRGDVVECPFHGGQFEVQTGRAVMPPTTEAIPTFEVRVVGDDIQVALP